MKCEYGERVRLVRLGDDCSFEGYEGTVTGCSYFDGVHQAYIVDLDQMIVQPSGKWKSISITEHCLERI